MDRKMFDTPVLPRLEVILSEVASGDLVIPSFQRPFVWDDERRLSLLDSIAKGLPIGALLVWRTTLKDLGTYKDLGGVKLQQQAEHKDKIAYLIDGHQRISTLFGALYTGDRLPKTDKHWPLYYELGDYRSPAFRLPPRQPPPETWLPMNILLDADRLWEFTTRLRELGLKDLAREAERLANLFKDYIIPIVPLVSDDLDIVTDAFVRINSQGKGMTEAHMLRALTYVKKTDTDKAFAGILDRLVPLGWHGLGEQLLVNALKATLNFDVYGSSVRELFNALQYDPTALDRLSDSVYQAVEFLCSLGVKGPDALPYAYQLVTLAALANRHPEWVTGQEYHPILERWFWQTSYLEHFTGITGSQIREGIQLLEGSLNEFASKAPPLESFTVRSEREIEPFRSYRNATVRTKAFLLFMAQLPSDPEARVRRLEELGRATSQSTPKIYSGQGAQLPENHVIAGTHEINQLRMAIKQRAVTTEMADEYAIPREALQKLPDEAAFLAARRRWLHEQERDFAQKFGILFKTESAEPTQTDLDEPGWDME